MKNRRNDIERYIRGELSPAEMHDFEKEALNDPFLAEALEGLEQTGADNFLFDLHAISRSVHDRARGRKNRIIKMWGWTAAIAATLLLVAISGFLVVTLMRDQHVREQAMEAPPGPVTGETTTPSTTEPGIDTVARPLDTPTPSVTHHATPAQQRASAGRDASDKALAEAEKKDEDLQTIQPDLLAENHISELEESKSSERESRRETQDVAAADVTAQDTRRIETAQKREKETALPGLVEKSVKRGEIGPGGQTRAKSADAPEALAAVPVQLKGKVVSAEDGEGLPGVTVMVKGTSIGSVTDAAGNYTITPPSLDSKLLFSFVGFETEEVDAAGRNEVDVKLQANVDHLSEVVVTGYGSTSSQTVEEAASFHVAEPEGGKTSLRRYLLESLTYPQEALKSKVEGKVTVRFTVLPDGALTDFEVLKGIGSGCDEELIRLIKEGPSWKPARQGDTPVADKVKVRFKFELPR